MTASPASKLAPQETHAHTHTHTHTQVSVGGWSRKVRVIVVRGQRSEVRCLETTDDRLVNDKRPFSGRSFWVGLKDTNTHTLTHTHTHTE